MATISVSYMTYQFIPPFGSISESTYQEVKGKLKTDPNFTLLEKDPPISEEFKDDIRLGKKYFKHLKNLWIDKRNHYKD